MKRFLQEYDEDARHRKKSKTSKTSKSVQRSNHKHEYEKVIIREFIGYAWGGRCRLCGKFRAITVSFLPVAIWISAGRTPLGNKEFPTSPFFSLEEIRAKFPDVPIYEFSYEDVQYHFVP